MMRSFHCPNLVRIGCNADFLSRFQVSDVSGMYIPLVAGSDRIELKAKTLHYNTICPSRCNLVSLKTHVDKDSCFQVGCYFDISVIEEVLQFF